MLTILALLFVTMPVFQINTVRALSLMETGSQQMIVEAKPVDPRTIILKNYFAKYDSPLQNHAQDFINAADTYSVDWKLVPAIAGVESTFGKSIPGGYNGWGWGVYGNQAMYFTSWRQGIFTVTRGLKENYINKGLTTPYAMNQNYATSPFWGAKVAYFMQDLEKFAKETGPKDTSKVSKKDALTSQPAGGSAQLALLP